MKGFGGVKVANSPKQEFPQPLFKQIYPSKQHNNSGKKSFASLVNAKSRQTAN
jgi:hypothetical protein